jgi:uncharacterized protein (TIGR02266 family)
MLSTIPLAIPVRFSGGGLSLQTTSGRIGAEGVFLRSIVSPKEGARLDLALWLPGSQRPLDATGTVLRRENAGNEQGFWVRFDEVSEDARAFLDVLLRSRGVAGLGRAAPRPARARADSARAYPRIPARLRVGWTSAREFLVAYSENISRGGIFVQSDDPPALREVLELSVELPDGKPPVKTQAEVVQRVTAPEAREMHAIAGAGLQFIGANDEFRQRLDACIEALLNQDR